MSNIDPTDSESVAKLFGIPYSLACEIVYMNDEACWMPEEPENRFRRMAAWIEDNVWGSCDECGAEAVKYVKEQGAS